MNENNILQYINQLESNLGYSLEPSYATLTSINDHNNDNNKGLFTIGSGIVIYHYLL